MDTGHGDRTSDDEPQRTRHTTDGPDALADATNSWLRRGYRLLYRDEYLVQLVGRRRFDATAAMLCLAAGGSVVALLLRLRHIRRRPWHVVSMVRSPGSGVFVHRTWTRHLPGSGR